MPRFFRKVPDDDEDPTLPEWAPEYLNAFSRFVSTGNPEAREEMRDVLRRNGVLDEELTRLGLPS